MRALVTGATGFVGSHLVRLLRERDVHVAIVRRPASDLWRLGELSADVEHLVGDLRAVATLLPGIEAFAPDVVFHLGWGGVANVHRNDPAQFENPACALDLLGGAARAGVRTWIGLGSQAEYGSIEGRIGEDHPTRPTTLYGIAKLATGLATLAHGTTLGLRVAWLRLFSTYGPMDGPGWLIPSVARELLAGRTPPLTLGTQRWDYLYVRDVAEALYAAASAPQVAGCYNLGSGEARTVRSIVEAVRARIPDAPPLAFGAVPFRADQVMHLEADTTRLRRDTGWAPIVAFDDGVSQTVQWIREHGIVD